jgi:hypothetical protein
MGRMLCRSDEIGPDGVKVLEERLLSFRGYCNRIKSSAGSNEVGNNKHAFTMPPRRNIPMTGAKYGGLAGKEYLILIICNMF